MRADIALAEMAECTRSHAQKLLAGQKIRRNGDVISTPKTKVYEGDMLEMEPRIYSSHLKCREQNPSASKDERLLNPNISHGSPIEPIEPVQISLDIVYEDESLLVINKPAGLVVHPAAGHSSDTLVNAVIAHCPCLSDVGDYPGIVHRLDKDTSGLILVAKNNVAHQALAEQFAPVLREPFREKKAKRTYVALVYGKPQPSNGTIKTYIARHRGDRKRMCAIPMDIHIPSDSSGFIERQSIVKLQKSTRRVSREPYREGLKGRLAITQYELIKTWNADCDQSQQRLGNYRHKHGAVAVCISLVQFQLLTGRTHQIRVHCQHAGFPIVGDSVYGKKHPPFGPEAIADFPRQALHAANITFEHPETHESLKFEAPLPDDMTRLLSMLQAPA
jgi:23S rRNA pseudouridine1911/1915/1917 synthase